ncbi:MAG: M28 family peptidase [Armatimonadetes bacterium]|nr:M28 family peptidase [Armatimonadota bacterium]
MRHALPWHRWTRLLAVTGWLVAAAALQAAPPPDSAVSNPQITSAEVMAHIRYLASDELQGRGSGTPGAEKAAAYLTRRFRVAGLLPAVQGSYLQKFGLVVGVRMGQPNKAVLTIGGQPTELRLREEFLPVAFTRNGQVAAEVVFAGYGISQPQLGYDDYAGLDVRGKIVLLLRHTPDDDDHGKFGPYAPLRYKIMTAREKGAVGAILFTGTQGNRPDDLGDLRTDGSFGDSGIPAIILRRRAAEAMLAVTGRPLADLQTAMAHGQPQSFALPGVRADLTTNVVSERRTTANVVGRLPGSDPQLAREYVVIGAHYDHLGMGGVHSLDASGRPAIHHGADDNASGTAGVLELAQYFAARRKMVKRSLLFVGFSGEELGLLGSAYFVRKSPVPLDKIVAMINLDMIGRSREGQVQVIGTGTSPQWKEWLEAANQRYRLAMRGSGSGFGASDQQSFYARNIPVLFFFTGAHADYHRPSDTAEKINAEGEVKILKFVADTVERVARAPERPTFTRSDETASPGGVSFGVYLGTIPDYSENPDGVLLSGVREGSPAERGDVRAGDIIVEFGGRRVRNVQEYTYALRDAKPDVPVKMVVLRHGQRVELEVTPAARR